MVSRTKTTCFTFLINRYYIAKRQIMSAKKLIFNLLNQQNAIKGQGFRTEESGVSGTSRYTSFIK